MRVTRWSVSVTDKTKSREATSRRRLEALRGISGRDVPSCECCGETRVWSLTFDHIAGGGRQHRMSRKNAATVKLVRAEWRLRGEWPRDVYQVLCATCNHGRRVSPTGECPHTLEGR